MKKIILYLLLSFGLFITWGCHKNNDVADPDRVGISRIIYFPIIETKGSTLLIINRGTTFTDPGVTATVNGQPVTPEITGSVNTAVSGIYYLKYTAANSEGYTASANRIVIVKNPTPASPDYSGSWRRNAGALGTSTWIQLTPTTYAVNDPGGAGSAYSNFWCVVTITGTTPSIAAQNVPQTLGGTPTNINTTSSGPITGTTAGSSYNWALNTSGFGTGNRIFVKQ